MATKTARKRNTSRALVFNPAGRSLSIGGGRVVNPRRRRKAASSRRRRNPIRKAVATRRNPIRRKSNPATVTGLVTASVMAGISVSIFDLLTSKFLPQSSALMRIGVKAGGAWLFQSSLGAKIPVLGKYRHEAALVLGVSAFVDVFKLWVLPAIAPTLGMIGLAPAPQLAAGDESMGNIYGNAFTPDYQPYS